MVGSDYAQAEAWEKLKRIAVIGCLVLSAFQTWGLALILGVLGNGENDKLLAAALLLFGGLAIAVAFGFRKLREPSWKHWLIVVILATPGALTVLSN